MGLWGQGSLLPSPPRHGSSASSPLSSRHCHCFYCALLGFFFSFLFYFSGDYFTTRDFAFLQQRTWSQPGSAFMRAFRRFTRLQPGPVQGVGGGGRRSWKSRRQVSASSSWGAGLFLSQGPLVTCLGRARAVVLCVSSPSGPQFPCLSRGCVWSIQLRVVGRSHAQRRIRPSGHRTDPSPRTLPVSLGSAGRPPASPGTSNFP